MKICPNDIFCMFFSLLNYFLKTLLAHDMKNCKFELSVKFLVKFQTFLLEGL